MDKKLWNKMFRNNSLREDIGADIAVANVLSKLIKVSEDKADSIMSGFKSGAGLNQKKQYWAAVKSKNYKKAAQIIKKAWWD